MATSIHHGSPGSFKSFSLVQRFGIDALKEGRVVVTNVRGFDDVALIKEQFPEIIFPDTAQIIFVNTSTKEGRRIMGGWFHWIPFGALVLMDEGQRIYPKRNSFKLDSLDAFVCPEGITPLSDCHGEPRPEDVYTAFDMQRHFQWEVLISTTHVKKIQDSIREVAEYGYYHLSLSNKIPFLFKNQWYEFKHDPENTGHLPSHCIGKPKRYKADEKVFKCYKSTATGEHSESKADQNIFSDSGVKLKLGFIVFALIAACVLLALHFSTKDDLHKNAAAIAPPVETPVPAVAPVFKNVSLASADTPSGNVVGNGSAGKNSNLSDVLGYKILLIAYHDTRDKQHERLAFIVDSPRGLKVVKYTDFAVHGVKAYTSALCSVYLVYDGITTEIGCNHADIDKCSANMQSGFVVSRHNCKKYSDVESGTPNTITAAVKDNRAVLMAQAATPQ